MDPTTNSGTLELSKELLDAQAHIWNHTFSFQNSMALKCALQLEIPDVIQKYGKSISLSELANVLDIHPTKAPSLYRLMRLLSHNNFFSEKKLPSGEIEFGLTTSSQLLLKSYHFTQAPFVLGMLDPALTDPSHHLANWFKTEHKSPFNIAHGMSIWEHAGLVTKFNDYFNQAMASDAQFVASLLVSCNETKGLINGLNSLVDVAGGDGTMAKTIAKAYPGLNVMVLDLPHVVEGLQDEEYGVVYIGGDMFKAIPSANAVLLKWILHNWSDEDCITILKRCKEAIPTKDQGGKVIVIDTVVEKQNDIVGHSSSQILFDMEMMSNTVGGKERTAEEWEKLFMNSGFSDYKISPVLGLRSVIEIYPIIPPLIVTKQAGHPKHVYVGGLRQKLAWINNHQENPSIMKKKSPKKYEK